MSVATGNQQQQSLPLVSFIVPSSLQRNTLNRTIQSLKNQTLTNWEAVVGVDVVQLKDKDIANKSEAFLQDPRVRYVAIDVKSTDRGVLGNGAGEIRNAIIKQFAKSDWVAFVDDDDTLFPLYVEHLSQATREQPSADVVVFRMRARRGHILPPPKEQDKLAKRKVGISFAVRKDFFVREHNPIVFVPGATEDFILFKNSSYDGFLCLAVELCQLLCSAGSGRKTSRLDWQRAVQLFRCKKCNGLKVYLPCIDGTTDTSISRERFCSSNRSLNLQSQIAAYARPLKNNAVPK